MNRSLIRLLTAISMLVIAPAAMGHARLLSSTPAPDSTSAQPIKNVTLKFSGPIRVATAKIAASGKTAQSLKIEKSSNATTIKATASPALTGGLHRLKWSVEAADGHTMSGTIAMTAPAAAAAEPVESDDTVQIQTSPNPVDEPSATPTPTVADEPVDSSTPWGAIIALGALLIAVAGAAAWMRSSRSSSED